jgi:hypothetical protein
MNVVNFEPKPETNQLQCTSCGATTDAPCKCGVPFKLLIPEERIKIVIDQHPGISARKGAKLADVNPHAFGRVKKMRENLSPPSKESFWTEEKDAEIMRLHKEGKGGSEIAETMGITRGAASGRVQRLMNIRPDLASRRLPPEMPENILEQAMYLTSVSKTSMFDVDTLSLYVDQMHEDVRQLIAEDVQVVHNLSREIIRRLVGGVGNIRAPACGVDIKIKKED